MMYPFAKPEIEKTKKDGRRIGKNLYIHETADGAIWLNCLVDYDGLCLAASPFPLASPDRLAVAVRELEKVIELLQSHPSCWTEDGQ